MADLKRVNLRIRKELYEWLKVSAEGRGLSMNAMCILALETYLTQQKYIDILPDVLEEAKKQK